MRVLEAITGRKVKLTDIYQGSELRDENELLVRVLDDIGRIPTLKFEFTVHTMPAAQAAKIKMFGQTRTVLAAFKKTAVGAQKKVVKDKVKNFNNDRIVVLMGGDMIDGHHHLIAAIQTGNPISYIDLDEVD